MPPVATALLPGGLSMWDGHAAMIVRNSTMIEAGCEWEFT